jgi:hypothetical protein
LRVLAEAPKTIDDSNLIPENRLRFTARDIVISEESPDLTNALFRIESDVKQFILGPEKKRQFATPVSEKLWTLSALLSDMLQKCQSEVREVITYKP